MHETNAKSGVKWSDWLWWGHYGHYIMTLWLELISVPTTLGAFFHLPRLFMSLFLSRHANRRWITMSTSEYC